MKKRLMNPSFPAALSLLACSLVELPIHLEAQQSDRNVVYDPALFQAMEYRSVGPHRGGRVTAVAGVIQDPYTYYMGSTGGGVWKTTDGGEVWRNVYYGFFAVGSMGALAVAPSDPNVVYAGTGSACIRGNVSTGIGAYRSTDAGRTWTHIGLDNAGQIGRIRVHPDNPDLVYAAVLGHPFGPNPERGVFRSRDGGDTWENVLFISDSTGAVDLSMDANNPRILYAAMWRAERKPWTLISGALEGGIYKTGDGGDSWTKLTKGLPESLVGKIGVAVSPANSDRVWAVIEAAKQQGGVYRSDDAGATWSRVNKDRQIISRPWYYNHIYADPQDENTVYVVGNDFWKSVDGGVTFEQMDTPHGDNHDMWINPNDPKIMIESNDGGANISYNSGKTWSVQTNQPTAEFYSVTVDNRFPYRVYGPQQDNSTISVPSRAEATGITIQRWLAVGGCETGPIAVHPGNPDIIYAACYRGRLTRFDRTTGQMRQIADYPQAQRGRAARDLRYRFQWNAPVMVSNHDPTVLYHASQYVHRSTNEGQSWEVISPDLTRNDVTKQGFPGEPITHDMTGVEIYGSVFALKESPDDPAVLWIGSNDGLVHVTRDGGGTWQNVTPQQIPEFSTVSNIDVSVHTPGRAFVAVYRYRMDDFKPYIFRTDDYGESWKLLTNGRNGIPANHPTRVVREDPDRRGLLYAGTEFGLFVSFDDGEHWQSLQLNLPATPVTDLLLHEKDLVVATQGRSFWILDDVTPLRQMTDEVARAPAHLFQPRGAYRTLGGRPDPGAYLVRDAIGGARMKRQYAGENPPTGAMIFYTFAQEPEEVTLEVLDGQDRSVRTYSSEDGEVAKHAGMHRFVWDLTYPGSDVVQGDQSGPRAVPGTYKVRLTADGWSQTQSFEVLKDPRLSTTLAEFRRQFDLLTQIRDKITGIHDAIRVIRSVTEQVQDLTARLASRDTDGRIKENAEAIDEQLSGLEGRLLGGDPLSTPQPTLAGDFGWLSTMVSSADAQPTDQSFVLFGDISDQLTEELGELDRVLATDVAAFNVLVRELGVPAVIVPGQRGVVSTPNGR